MSLSDYLRREITMSAERLTLEEAFERAKARGSVEFDEDPVVTLRKLRGPLRE